jgi:uncharacterized lipoprotein YddW (UPF0748 family)
MNRHTNQASPANRRVRAESGVHPVPAPACSSNSRRIRRRAFGSWLPRRFVAALALALASALCAGAAGTAESVAARQAPPAPADEVRGVWMWSSAVTQKGGEAVAAELAQHHINKVFFLVKGISGRVCYASKLAPVSPGGDALKEILTACHKRGIEVHAWYVFNADNVWGRQHPADAMYHVGKADAWDQGPYSKKDDPEKIPICPLSPEYRQFIKGLIQEALDGYDVDGIHLDYIRYGHLAYCFCPRHQAYAASHGIETAKVRQAIYDTFYAPNKKSDHYFKLYRAGDKDVAGWVAMRQAEIDAAVTEIKAQVKAKRPSLVLSAAFMPEGGEQDDTFAICHYAQNYATAGAQLDYILPMTYWKTPQWVAQVARNAEKRSHRPVYSGLWACEASAEAKVPESESASNRTKDRDNPARALGERVQVLRDQGVKGFVLFVYNSMSDRVWKELP